MNFNLAHLLVFGGGLSGGSGIAITPRSVKAFVLAHGITVAESLHG
jgi:hypothetical protein